MKVNEVELLESKFRYKLLNLDETEIAAYLKELLILCLDDLENENLYNYNKHQNDLNKSINIIKYKIKNFKAFYNSIKLEVANNRLKQLLNYYDMNILDNTTIDADLREFKKIENIERFRDFEIALRDITEFDKNRIYSNKHYVLIAEGDSITIFDKNDPDKNFKLEYSNNLDVLAAFVTGNTNAISEDTENDLVKTRMQLNHYYFNDSYEYNEDRILYFKETDEFIVIVRFETFLISHKVSEFVFDSYFDNLKENENHLFVKDFVNYCLNGEDSDE